MKRIKLIFILIICFIGNSYSQTTYHKAVDLGLSVKWASCNIGANKPTDRGGYYGWADPSGENTTMDVMKEYKWVSPLYGGANPPCDICGSDLDIAHVKWGGEWRLPSVDEIQELINKCRFVCIGRTGMKVIGPNGNSIFLPYAGIRRGNKLSVLSYGSFDERGGYYWSGTRYQDSSHYPYFLSVDGEPSLEHSYSRIFGFSVRPVLPKTDNSAGKFGEVADSDIVATPVDLGLSMFWASYNLGALKPEQYGGFYSWTDFKDKDAHDDKIIDIVSKKWGKSWRMPKYSEMKELKEKCTWTWEVNNGVKGMRVTGPNGNSIFLPASGYSKDNAQDYYNIEISGNYWTRSCDFSYSDDNGWSLIFDNELNVCEYPQDRYYKYNIRPVTSER
jgi:hypothetical protein